MDTETISSLDSEALYKKYRLPLYRIVCRRLNGHKQDAEDVVQETFIEFIKSSESRAGDVRCQLSYLAGIALRVVYRRYFLEKREGIFYNSDLLAALIEADSDTSPDRLADALSLEKQMNEAILRLTKPQQLVLNLCKKQGATYEEASAETRISIHMVEKHLIKAVAALAQEKWDR